MTTTRAPSEKPTGQLHAHSPGYTGRRPVLCLKDPVPPTGYRARTVAAAALRRPAHTRLCVAVKRILFLPPPPLPSSFLRLSPEDAPHKVRLVTTLNERHLPREHEVWRVPSRRGPVRFSRNEPAAKAVVTARVPCDARDARIIASAPVCRRRALPRTRYGRRVGRVADETRRKAAVFTVFRRSDRRQVFFFFLSSSDRVEETQTRRTVRAAIRLNRYSRRNFRDRSHRPSRLSRVLVK